uniref:gasdermin-B n=1 Tax=Nyctereutes procyonoides TaxID=34880 RepID=UPI002443FE0E|nr:gasdermin-B [Nyctereutes procyonoides]
MSSIFEEITRVVVQEMDAGGDMIAVRSILHADRFHCSSLVRGRRNFWGHQYHRTDLILEDILERGEGEELFEKLDSGPQGQCEGFRVLDTGDSKGMLTVKLPKEITIARALHKSHKQRVQMLETHIPQQYLDFLELREAGVGQRVFFNAAEFLVKTHIESILDILDNLIELSEEQCLMAEAPEKGTLPL